MAIDVNHLPEAAHELGDLTPRERDVLALLGEGLASREIAERLALSEATVCLVIADLLDALEYKPPAASADAIHRRAGHVQRRRPRSRASTSSSGRSTPIAKAERWMPARPARAGVRFDPDALADDLARLSPPGRTALRHAHERFERDGVPLDRLRACQHEHRAGTSLPGCLKVYLPDWDGDWRMIFQLATDETGPLHSYLACGVAHQPRGTRAPDADQIAHHRLHGRWPGRRLL